MRNSLRTRLTIFFILMAFVPLLFLGIDSAIRTLRVQQQQALDLQNQVAQNVATEVDAFITGREDELHVLTQVNGIAYLSPEEQTDLLTNLLAHEGLYDELTLIDDQGQEQIRLSRYAFYGEKDLENRVGADEFERPKETEEIYFSSVDFNEATGEPFVTISVPLIDLRSGDFTGVLTADFRFKPIWDLMAQANVPGSGVVYMLDSNDLLVAHRNPSLVLQGSTVTIPNENTFATGLDGNEVALAFDEIQFGEEVFRVVAEIPSSEALALATSSVRSTVFVLIGSILAASIIGAIAAGRITQPINLLAFTAKAVAAGDLNQNVAISSKDEIGTLAVAFNSMTAQLRDLVSNLEQRVTARTHDLELANAVGRSVSEIRDTDELLSSAVKLIQDDFDLYLAQIYLVEDDQETLLLRAAEGQAANRLLAQEHYLAISMASINGTAVSEKRAVVVSNTAEDPQFRPNPLLPDTRSEMAVPLLVRNRVIGSLDVQSTIPNAFTEENVPAFIAMAGQLAIALENATLFSDRENSAAELAAVASDTEQQAQRLIALNEMGTTLAAATNLDEVYQIVSTHILSLVDGDRVSLTLVTEASNSAEVFALQGEQGAIPTGSTLPFTGTAVGLAITENRIVQLPKETPMSTYGDSRQLAQQGLQSVLITPLNASGQVIGTLNIGSLQSYAFSRTDINFVQQIVTLLATTIDSMTLIDRVQNLASIVESHPDAIGTGDMNGRAIYINPAGRALFGLPEDEDVTLMEIKDFYIQEDAERFQQEGIPTALSTGSWSTEAQIHKTNGAIIPVEQTIAVIYDNKEQPVGISITLRDITNRKEAAEAQNRLATQLEERLLQVNAMQRVMTHEGWSAFLTAETRLVQGFKFNNEQIGLISTRDLQQNPTLPRIIKSKADSTPSDLSSMATPVQVRGETIGVIGARNPDGSPLTNEQTAILNSMSQQVAMALDRARLFEEMEMAREQMNALYIGSERVIRAQSVDEVLVALIESTRLKRMDTANFLFFNQSWDNTAPETMTIAALWERVGGFTPEKVGEVYDIEQFPSLANISKDEPTLFYDVATDERAGPDAKILADLLGVKCVMYFPLIVGDQWVGLLSTKAKEAIKLSDDDIKQIVGLVGQAATASQTQQLFMQAQSRVRREQLLREVSTKVYAAPDAETILKTAVKEVSRIMGVDSFVYLDDQSPKQAQPTNGTPLEPAETTGQEG